MPYKSEYTKLKIQEKDKRNTKLSEQDKTEIKKLYETGLYSQRQLAKQYNVSRRLIVFCIYPEKYEENRKQFKERQKTGMYYDREKQREYTQKLREHRKELYLKGELI